MSALLPEKVLLLTVTVAPVPLQMPPPSYGAIAGEGAVAHGQRAAVVVDAAAAGVALLPEKVLLLTVTVPPAL